MRITLFCGLIHTFKNEPMIYHQSKGLVTVTMEQFHFGILLGLKFNLIDFEHLFVPSIEIPTVSIPLGVS